MLNELLDKNQEKYLKAREDKILTQLSHMQGKHKLERDAMMQKMDLQSKEQEKSRRLGQQELL